MCAWWPWRATGSKSKKYEPRKLELDARKNQSRKNVRASIYVIERYSDLGSHSEVEDIETGHRPLTPKRSNMSRPDTDSMRLDYA